MRLFGVWCMLLLCLQGVVLAQDDSAEVTETPEPQITITVWWPENFARVNESDINPTLLLQSDAFAAQYNNVQFDHRLKATGGQTGSIMSTLRSATSAARGALPTLTLVRRQDLLNARSNEFIQLMEGIPSTIQGDLNNALTLGQVDDDLYGLPYLLDLLHVVYRPDDDSDYERWSFDDVIEREQTIIFPAGRTSSLNDVVALQYINGGGLATDSNNLILNAAAVEDIFVYYQNLVDAELLSGDVLNFPGTTNYIPLFVAGDYDAIVMTSTQYLTLLRNDDGDTNYEAASIPTASGDMTTFLNGWMWVITTQNERERVVALEYLDFLFAPEQHRAAADAVGMLPSRERTILSGFADRIDTDFYLDLIESGVLPLSEASIGVTGREIQTQFATILTLEQSAEAALQAVLTTLDN